MNIDSIKLRKYQVHLIANPQFWLVIAVFTFITIHYYGDLVSFTLFTVPDTYLGLTRHTIDRILYLVPVIISSFIFGLRGGFIALIAAFLIMLPRVIFISQTPIIALLETFVVTLIGSLAPLWSSYYSKQEEQLEVAIDRLESTQRKLHSKVRKSMEQEKQLAVINAFSKILSQSLELKQVIETVIDMVMEVMQVEVVLVFSLDTHTQELRISGFKGIDKKTALALDRMKIGEDFSERMAETGQLPAAVHIPDDLCLCASTTLEESFKTQLCVPLVARGRIMGTLRVSSRSHRQFKEPEIELLSALGNLIGIAVDSSQLYHDREITTKRLKSSEKKYRQLFENAHDAIWVQDLSGKITAANHAAAELFGYPLPELIGTDDQHLLSQEGFALSREIQYNLLNGKGMSQPYTQKLTKKDGSEAVLTITTNLISVNGHPDGFQFIGRDITKEVRMQENQRFYLQQITRAHEEERLRISRDLHDSTAQNLIAALHQLESFCQADEYLPMPKLRFLWGLHEQLKDTLQDIRQLSRDLRPSILDDLGLLPAVEWLTEQLKTEQKISANLSISGEERRFSPEIEVTLFRIIQEALRNILRHAEATEAQVIIDLKNTETKVTIIDNGKGFALPASTGEFSRLGKLGIDGMQTRARLVGGTFDVKSEPGKGTTIIVTVPAQD
ncbi:MAG: PAS domain S-box protein [Actinobacteria bacterium]|nr:PAS domain S-box protein [Actinomycetota bacterium]